MAADRIDCVHLSSPRPRNQKHILHVPDIEVRISAIVITEIASS